MKFIKLATLIASASIATFSAPVQAQTQHQLERAQLLCMEELVLYVKVQNAIGVTFTDEEMQKEFGFCSTNNYQFTLEVAASNRQAAQKIVNFVINNR